MPARTPIAVGLSLLALAAMPGCYFHSAGSSERLAHAPTIFPREAWPATPQRALDEVLFASRDTAAMAPAPGAELVAAMGAGVGVGAGSGMGWRGELPAETLAALRTPVGLVRMRVTRDGRPLNADADILALFRGFVANAWVQTGLSFGSTAERMQVALEEAGRSPGEEPLGCIPPIVRRRTPTEDGIPIRIPPSIPPQPRGVILHLWALMSNPYEQEVMREFADRGWVVVDIDTLNGIAAEADEARINAGVQIQRRIASLRPSVPAWDLKVDYQTYAAMRRAVPEAAEIDRLEARLDELRRPATVIRTVEEAERAAPRLAAAIDRTLAANAYAAEAALAAVRTVYPQTGARPTVVMGFSAGALSAPTVAARLRSKVSAVVIIGGAANLLETAVNSTLTDGGLRLQGRESTPEDRGTPRRERDDRLKPEVLEALSRGYLEHSRLDPYHTAPSLDGLPVLQVHAYWDTWVPAANGDLLFERLGGPERLLMPGGHGMLFYFLPNRKRWLADWVEAQAVRRPSAR